MPTEKISATLDREVVKEIRRLVGPREVSRFLSSAASEKLQRIRILGYLDELDARHGVPDNKTRMDAARRIADLFGPR